MSIIFPCNLSVVTDGIPGVAVTPTPRSPCVTRVLAWTGAREVIVVGTGSGG